VPILTLSGTRDGLGIVTVQESGETTMEEVYDQGVDTFEETFDHVGTVDVQILLSWFFETADPMEVEYDRPSEVR
jgi:hypothetical protein